jgi:dihydroorotate dehydrogenase
MDAYTLIRSLLFTLPPEFAHAVSLSALNVAQRLELLAALSHVPTSPPVTLMGLRFPNRLGLAAGIDKNARCVDAFGTLGFGFIEVGTVTPQPQPGNSRPRLFRLIRDRALINRMGFPNDGVIAIRERLKNRRYGGICGVNVGKNAVTPLSDAVHDYLACLEAVYPYADYVAINISSPNTTGLRRLQQREWLGSLLSALVDSRSRLQGEYGRYVPLLVKVATDQNDTELAATSRTIVDFGMDGIIASNTTLTREALTDPNCVEAGGLSGAPLLARSLRAVQRIRTEVGAGFPIIGVGGIESANDAMAMRAAGANVLQFYTGLVYHGPRLVREILNSPANA